MRPDAVQRAWRQSSDIICKRAAAAGIHGRITQRPFDFWRLVLPVLSRPQRDRATHIRSLGWAAKTAGHSPRAILAHGGVAFTASNSLQLFTASLLGSRGEKKGEMAAAAGELRSIPCVI